MEEEIANKIVKKSGNIINARTEKIKTRGKEMTVVSKKRLTKITASKIFL